MEHKTSFWAFIKKNKIEIPIIQRDYAQGRIGKENLRKSFLSDLKKALDNDHEEMKLDFVYGSTEKNILNPLDGQQRLTTLWLLHWYIALRAGVLNDDNCDILKRFTYETRISSREFCQRLCDPKHFEKFDGNNIVGFITKQTWFYSAWKQDPTIQSMLRMLGGTKIQNKKGVDIVDGIEELFVCPSECKLIKNQKCAGLRKFKEYWDRLSGENCPIVFYHLPLEDFGLSDDLYIKMNARGKQLTSFENFKADLIGYITKQSENEELDEREAWKELLDPQNGIPIKLDTDWTNVFWKTRSCGISSKEGKRIKENQIDEIYFAFLNRFFWNELFVAKTTTGDYILDIGKGDEESTQENNNKSYKYLNDSKKNTKDFDTKIAYEGLDVYRYANDNIPLAFFQKLRMVLDNFSDYDANGSLPCCLWDQTFRFIPEYIRENGNNVEIVNNSFDTILKVSFLTQVQRIVYFAVCKYFHDGVADDLSMKRWMRVVWNLVSGEGEDGKPQIRSTQAVRTAIEFIDDLNSHQVYESLIKRTPYAKDPSDFERRCNEEIAKAKQIVDGNNALRIYDGCHQKKDGAKYQTWEDIIVEAENYAFFKGAIRFLFTNEDGSIVWSDFDEKWRQTKLYFKERANSNESVMNEKYRNANLLKALFSRFTVQNYNDVLWWRHRSFNNRPESWLYYLLNSKISGPVHHLMIGDTEILTIIEPKSFKENPLYLLSNTKLIDFVREKIPYSWIRYYHNHTAIYPSGTGVFLDAKNRDQFLQNTSGIQIDESYKVYDTGLLFGSDINFKYTYEGKIYNFQWYRSDYVYLMENDDPDKYIKRDASAKTECDKYYCFDASGISDTATIIGYLTQLIKSAFSCQDK